MQRTQIYLHKKHIDELDKIASKKKSTLSGVIRMFIEDGLTTRQTRKGKRKIKTMFDVLKVIQKKREKGPRDLSRNIDQYLYGA